MSQKKISWADLKAIVNAKPQASIQAFLQDDHWFLSYTDGTYTLTAVLSVDDPAQSADVTDFVTNYLPNANEQIDTKQIRGGTDGSFIGNIGNALRVTQSAVSGSGVSVVPAEKVMNQPMYLENIGSRDMNVIGSVTPVEFDFTPGVGETWYFEKLAVLIVDPGSMDLGDFGSIAGPLTNGCLLEIKANGIVHTSFNFTDNIDLTEYFSGSSSKSSPGGDNDNWLDESDYYQGVKGFGPVITLDGNQGDYIKLIVRDDISKLKAFCMMAHLWKVIG